MKWWLTVLLLVSVTLAGCSEGSDPVTQEDPSDEVPAEDLPPAPGEYLMVWIQGSETREVIFGVEGSPDECQVPFDHLVRPEEQELKYHAGRYDVDRQTVETMMAFRHHQEWDTCDGVQIYELAVDKEGVTRSMGDEYGDLTLERSGDRVLVEQGEENADTLEVGDERTITYTYEYSETGTTYEVTGEFFVKNLGLWQRTGLIPNG